MGFGAILCKNIFLDKKIKSQKLQTLSKISSSKYPQNTNKQESKTFFCHTRNADIPYVNIVKYRNKFL